MNKKSKILSNRQLKRRAQKSANLLKSALSSVVNETLSTVSSSLQHVLEGANDNLHESNIEIENNTSEFNNILLNSKQSTISSSSNDYNMHNKLTGELREWAVTYKVKSNSISALLKILSPTLNFLPTDYRALLGTPRSSQTISLNNGEMIYLGILTNIMDKLPKGLNSNTTTISLQVNVDGIPIFKSSGTDLYPILSRSNDLADSDPFPIAIFCGIGKPEPLHLYLKNFIDEFKKLQQEGIHYEGQIFSLEISCFICDAPARAFLKQTVSHTGKHGCEKCTIVGKYENHRINYAETPIEHHPKRTIADFMSESDNAHIKDKTPLLEIGINLIDQFPLDPMHLVYLGVVKRLLLSYFVEGVAPYKLSQKILKEINLKIINLQSFIPSDFIRKPRSFKEMKRWKATEFRLFLLYTGPILLHNSVAKDNYEHFLNLHCAIYILSNSQLINQYFDVAKICLNTFVLNASNLYGRDFVVYNVHNLLHLCDDVKMYGNVNLFTCFPFENYLGLLKSKIHSKKHVLQQVHRRITELNGLQSINHKNRCNSGGEQNEIIPKKLFMEVFDFQDKLISFSCSKLIFRNYSLTIKKPDNCVILKNKKVCLIKTIRFNVKYYLEGLTFRYQQDLYLKPIHSSKLNIFYVKNISSSGAVSFDLDDILFKCLRIPHKQGFAVFPLSHTV